MESVKTQSTLYFIGVIAKLSGEIDYDDFKQKTENINQFQDYIKTIHEFDQEHSSCLIETLRIFNEKSFRTSRF